jgi:arsenite methyltransferase
VGTGDGLIAFGALDRVGPSGRVVFTDVSEELLSHCRQVAADRGASGRCTFVRTPAQDLGPIGDGSVDAVTTRSVLIYVAEKDRAFAEFHRVLRPGGRLSIFEPINRYFGPKRDRLLGVDVTGVEDLADRLVQLYDRLQPPDTDPMLNFGERDLIDLALAAGLRDVHLDLSIAVEHRHEAASWTSFFYAPPNPLVPSLAEGVAEVMSPQEAERFVAHVRPLVESGDGVDRTAVAYLRARRPDERGLTRRASAGSE